MSVCYPCRQAGMTLAEDPTISDKGLRQLHNVCLNYDHPTDIGNTFCDCQHNRWGVPREDVTVSAGHHSSEL